MWGIWLAAADQRLSVKLLIYSGLGMCVLSFPLYDWHWSCKVKDVIKEVARAVLNLVFGK